MFKQRRGKAFIFFFVLAAASEAAEPVAVRPLSRYIVKSWTTDDGLPQSAVQTVIQSRDGFLWLGTQEGLVRFNGVEFSVFNKKNVSEFRHNDVRALAEDRDGRLWIGTVNGLLSYKNGQFSTHFIDPRGEAVDFISVIASDPRGAVWIGTFGGGLLQRKDDKVITLTMREGLAGDVINAIWIDQAGVAWIGTANGLDRIQDGRISHLTTKDGLPGNHIMAIRESQDGSLWVATRNGLASFQGGRVQVFSTADGLTSDVVNCLYEDHQGGLWAGTEGRGLNRLIEGKFFPFTQEDGLSDDYVLSLCQDREGLLWVGTYGGGLNRLWEGKFTTYTVRDGLPSNEIRTILETRDGSVWMGTRAAGLARLRDEKIEKYSTENGLPNNTVRALFEDAEGDLWIGTNNGLSRYRHGRFTNYSRNEGLAHDYVRCIAQDLAGRIWVGTTGGGLHLLQNGRFINYRDRDVPETVIRGLSVVRDGSLWIGSNDGLTHWQDGRATHYSAESGLPPAPVYVVYEDSAGTLWIGTYGGGLCRFRDGRFTRYTVREGLFDDVVYQILDDGRGLWMSSNLGIFRVSKTALDDFAAGRTDRLTCVSYGTADGMRSSECNGNAQPAGWKTRDGRLWFPTTGGVVVVDPAAIPGNRLPPLVSFEDVRINRQSYCPVIEAVVPPGADSFEARFAGLSFIAPEKVRYKYRLEGLDKEWIEAGGRREAYYTNLSPGSYRFRVLACNNDGLWDETGAAFTFTLRPSFFQRRGFYILVALTFILLGITASEWRLRRLRTRQRELSGLVDVRTRELAVANLKLEDANRRLEELANTDPLTGLANRRYFMAALEVERRRCERLALPLSVIMADVDHFKLFNDAYGHHAGDECLVRLASLMRETVARAGDLVGRYGGEEFIILLPATGAEGAARAAERLRRHIEEAGIEHPSSSCGRNVTVSFGVATFVPKAGLAPDPLLEAADQALYEAKNAGRNCSRTRTL